MHQKICLIKKDLRTKIARFSGLIPMLIICLSCITTKTEARDKQVSSQPLSRPNIVLVLADDLSWFDIGAYHALHPDTPKNAITPYIDKLACEGMLFNNAFTTTAMCAVTRLQLYTGLYPVGNGAYGNHTRVYDGVKSAAHYFKALGYRGGLAGKKHIKAKGETDLVTLTRMRTGNRLSYYGLHNYVRVTLNLRF